MDDKSDSKAGRSSLLEDYNDPDAQNSEQNEDGTQAQDIADEALEHGDDLTEDTERGGDTDPTELLPEDVPDLVEKMDEMVRSGRIDMDGFEGEEAMDDEDE